MISTVHSGFRNNLEPAGLFYFLSDFSCSNILAPDSRIGRIVAAARFWALQCGKSAVQSRESQNIADRLERTWRILTPSWF
jgi:hypothetical protein